MWLLGSSGSGRTTLQIRGSTLCHQEKRENKRNGGKTLTTPVGSRTIKEHRQEKERSSQRRHMPSSERGRSKEEDPLAVFNAQESENKRTRNAGPNCASEVKKLPMDGT